MPSVTNQTADEPVKLERVEVEPGVVLKLSPKDAEAYKARKAAEAASAAAYAALVSGASKPEVDVPDVPAEVPLTALTRAELVSIAEARGLKTSGSKPEIAARFGAVPDEAEGDSPTGPAGDGSSDGGAEAGAPAGAAPDATPAPTE